MKDYNYRYKSKVFQLFLMYYDVIITQNMQILSVKSYFFSNIKNKFIRYFYVCFFDYECKMCGVSKKDITYVKSFQLHVDIDIKHILRANGGNTLF